MLKIDEFVSRHGMSESAKSEMLEILNESLLEISSVIMRESKVKGIDNKRFEENCGVKKRYKSKKAEEYAEEHGLTLEDFEINEISKKDVENKVREMTKKKNDKIISNKKEKVEVKRDKVICSGINKKGEACKSVGTIKPDGAKKKYCFRHAEDFRSFECDSDSSEEEEESTQCETNTPKEVPKEPQKDNSDDELFEEEYN